MTPSFLKFTETTESTAKWQDRINNSIEVGIHHCVVPANTLMPFSLKIPDNCTYLGCDLYSYNVTPIATMPLASYISSSSGYVRFEGGTFSLSEDFKQHWIRVYFKENDTEDILIFQSDIIHVVDSDLIRIIASNNENFANIPFSLLSPEVYIDAKLSLPIPDVFQKGYEDGEKNSVYTLQKWSTKRQFSFIATDNMIEAMSLLQVLDNVTLVDEWGESYAMNDIEIKTEKINDYTALLTVTFTPYYFIKTNV